mmetsp:Transcript_28439/g.59467  ORF Transcript_28439/g.59467 Transcript_28439/m.59467 type:complete len:359 (-) Transcript_28439:1135-2211(-)
MITGNANLSRSPNVGLKGCGGMLPSGISRALIFLLTFLIATHFAAAKLRVPSSWVESIRGISKSLPSSLQSSKSPSKSVPSPSPSKLSPPGSSANSPSPSPSSSATTKSNFRPIVQRPSVASPSARLPASRLKTAPTPAVWSSTPSVPSAYRGYTRTTPPWFLGVAALGAVGAVGAAAAVACVSGQFSYARTCRPCNKAYCPIGQYRTACNAYSNSLCTACTNKPAGNYYTDNGDSGRNNCPYLACAPVDCTCASAASRSKYTCSSRNYCPWASCCPDPSCLFDNSTTGTDVTFTVSLPLAVSVFADGDAGPDSLSPNETAYVAAVASVAGVDPTQVKKRARDRGESEVAEKETLVQA